MYKTKLQELCHQRSLNTPDYSYSKEGPDHGPRFKASVTVDGLSFHTPHLCKSSKEAQNEAAKLALSHFTSPKPLLPPNQPLQHTSSISGSSNGSNDSDIRPATKGTLKLDVQGAFQTPQINENSSDVRDDKMLRVMHSYKNQLQNYAQKRNITLPMYTFECEGPPHVSRFKSKVTIAGQTYETPEFFLTLKEAEHAAAKVALMTLSPDGVQEDQSAFYKNLLQELAQKEGFRLPIYNATRSGACHVPTFVSTVEIEGEIFHGEEAKTKKQAEMNAAKVAYTGLTERISSRNPKFLSPGCQVQKVLEFSSSSLQSTTAANHVRPKAPLILSPSFPVEQAKARVTCKIHSWDPCLSDGDQEAVLSESITENVNVSTHYSPILSPELDINTRRNGGSSSSSDIVNSHLHNPFSVSSSPEDGLSSSTPSECSTNLVMDSNIKPPAGTSTLRCKKVTVYPRTLNMEFPVGATVLPISNDEWVAVSSEPNQFSN